MRVAVQHTDENHPNGGIVAFRFGRVQGFTNPLTGETTNADRMMVALLDQARQEFPEPDYRVFPQRLKCVGCFSAPHRNADAGCAETEAEWQDLDEGLLRERADGAPVDVAAPGEVIEHELTADQSTEAVQ